MWNKITILFLFMECFTAAFLCHAQEDELPIMVDVKYWQNAGDTNTGKALYINQYSYQFNLTICDTSGQPLSYYSPKDLEGFIYYVGNQKYEYKSMLNPVDMGKLFLQVVYKGDYILYQLLDVNYKSTVLSFLVSYYLWDDKWIFPPITTKYERESLLYHFSKCPELEFKIKTGEYGLSQIKEILYEFEHCNLTDEYEFFYE